jgi:integrase
MEKPALKLVVPDTVNGTTTKSRRTMPNRRANDRIRPRMHLTETEIARLKATAIKVNQYGFRDAVMISLAFRSCLRVGELVTLTWDCISFEEGTIHIRRLKGSDPSTHKIQGDMLRNLRRLKREQTPPSPFVFTSQQGAPISAAGFRKMLARLGITAGIDFPVNCHMLKHGGLTKLAGDGHDAITLAAYAGHRQLQNLQRYIRLSPEKFKDFRWKD